MAAAYLPAGGGGAPPVAAVEPGRGFRAAASASFAATSGLLKLAWRAKVTMLFCSVLETRSTVGTQPDTLQLTNDHRMLVVTLRGTPAQISLLDLRSFVARLVNIPGHSTTGHHWLSRDGRFSFVAVENPAGFVTVNNHTGMVVADHPYPNPPGGTRAHGVFALPNHTGGDHR